MTDKSAHDWFIAHRTVTELVTRRETYEVWATDQENAEAQLKAGRGVRYTYETLKTEAVEVGPF